MWSIAGLTNCRPLNDCAYRSACECSISDTATSTNCLRIVAVASLNSFYIGCHVIHVLVSVFDAAVVGQVSIWLSIVL